MDTIQEAKPRSRRRHGRELKRQVLAECQAPGASVAKVAMAHGLNTNLVHKWRREFAPETTAPIASFVPLAIAAPQAASEPQFLDLELQRGGVVVRVRWPMESVSSCASWLREILR